MPKQGATPTESADDGLAPDSTQPATGTQPQTGATPEDGTQETGSAPSLRELKLQNEAKERRLEANRLKARVEELEKGSLSQEERLQAKITEMEAREAASLQKARSMEVRAAASAAGALHPETIVHLIDTDEDDIDRAISKLKRQYPTYFTPRSATGTVNAGSTGTAAKQSEGEAMGDFMRQVAGRR